MATHNNLGKQGEAIAIDFLLQKGVIILEKNWRFHRAEIDIIGKEGDILVFYEVKTRATDEHGPPEAFLTEQQELRITDAASAYMDLIHHDQEIRFDLISITLHAPFNIKHIKDAFFPGVH